MGFQRAGDRIMVGHHQPVDLLAPAVFEQRLRGGQAVGGMSGVAVEFDGE
jgi:hypothetical protein